jgi:hypothetical protein
MMASSSNMRLVVATLFGAVLASLIGVAFVGIVFGLPVALDAVHPIDRVNDLRKLPSRVTIGAICGAILGGLAVFASRWPRRGVSLVWSVAIIAATAGVARIFTESPYRVAEPPLVNSYLAAGVGAVLAAVGIVSFGHVRSRQTNVR